MPIAPDELLGRLARTLREDVGPAVGEPFAKTQAFMASVILTKLAGQLRTRDEDALANDRDRLMLVARLRSTMAGASHADVAAAVDELEMEGGDDSWNRLVTALYAGRGRLGVDLNDELLGHVRVALRARLDRALVYSS